MRAQLLTTTVALAGIAAAGATAGEPGFATSRPPMSTVEPTISSIRAAAATAVPLSPVSSVKGKAFDRIIQVWLENTNYEVASADPNMAWLASQGILLTNYWAVTHPSEPNYIAAVGGDYFGMENDDFNRVPANVSTVVDLLDTKGISWGEYMEDLPYAGFQGFNFSNQHTFKNDYVRKHNPLMIYDSVTGNATRLSLIKNQTSFYADLAAKTLPQWSFFTPNMTNDAHDTNITFAGAYVRGLLEPLLNNSYFMDNTLVILSFDENEVYTDHNKVFTVLLGGVIDPSLHGTTDDTFYTHYSTISTVSANWDLPSLGRWDCGANILEIVANKTGYRNMVVDTTNLYLNMSYPGALSDSEYTAGWWPAPDTQAKCASGHGVLPSIVKTWGNSTGTYNYTNVFPYDALSGSSANVPTVVDVNDQGGSSTGSSPSGSPSSSPSSSTTSSAPASTSSGAAGRMGVEAAAVWGVAGLVAALL